MAALSARSSARPSSSSASSSSASSSSASPPPFKLLDKIVFAPPTYLHTVFVRNIPLPLALARALPAFDNNDPDSGKHPALVRLRQQLFELCSFDGLVLDVFLLLPSTAARPPARGGGNTKCCAKVTFCSADAAQRAVKRLNKEVFLGQKLGFSINEPWQRQRGTGAGQHQNSVGQGRGHGGVRGRDLRVSRAINFAGAVFGHTGWSHDIVRVDELPLSGGHEVEVRVTVPASEYILKPLQCFGSATVLAGSGSVSGLAAVHSGGGGDDEPRTAERAADLALAAALSSIRCARVSMRDTGKRVLIFLPCAHSPAATLPAGPKAGENVLEYDELTTPPPSPSPPASPETTADNPL